MIESVVSADGTAIAYERSGSGPPLVIVLGAFCDRMTGARLAAALEPQFTVYRYDRRGRGASGDTAPYAVEREIEDLDAVIARAGGSAFVYGHSSGAVLALEAAAGGSAITRLVAYEPPYIEEGSRPLPGADLDERLGQLVDAGQRGEAATLFLVEGVGVPPEIVATFVGSPGWAGMEAIAHTLPYDVRVVDNFAPVDRMAKIQAPTLVVAGGASPDWARTAVNTLAGLIPGARGLTIDGQDHAVADEAIAPVLVEFFS
jgi:pimeloyl-ACP methyl ester carboxylesterase